MPLPSFFQENGFLTPPVASSSRILFHFSLVAKRGEDEVGEPSPFAAHHLSVLNAEFLVIGCAPPLKQPSSAKDSFPPGFPSS